LAAGDTKNWFKQVVETEIGPLLEEYWFDSPSKAKTATEQLLTLDFGIFAISIRIARD
jgi:5-methylcytosine-specific restriction protein B